MLPEILTGKEVQKWWDFGTATVQGTSKSPKQRWIAASCHHSPEVAQTRSAALRLALGTSPDRSSITTTVTGITRSQKLVMFIQGEWALVDGGVCYMQRQAFSTGETVWVVSWVGAAGEVWSEKRHTLEVFWINQSVQFPLRDTDWTWNKVISSSPLAANKANN